MKLKVLLLTCVIKWCSGVRLSPLENNDKLEDITNLYVAEWQWESWPIKEGSTEQESRSPSQRRDVALWKESSGSAWYLFGGTSVAGDPKKMYSDIWKFTVKTRAWKRLFPSQVEVKPGNGNKTGEIIPFRVSFFDESNPFHSEISLQSKVLCGAMVKAKPSKNKKIKSWSGFRRKVEEEETEDQLSSLAVYAPKSSRSNTVWQMDVKKKLWTAYVCCCESVKSRNESVSDKNKKTYSNQTEKVSDTENSSNPVTNECSVSNSKINKAEDEIENKQQHFKMSDLKNKKKRINQMKNNSDKVYDKKIKLEKRGSSDHLKEKTETKPKGSEKNENKTVEGRNSTKDNVTGVKETKIKKEVTEGGKNGTVKPDKGVQPKMASKFCPEFGKNGTPVTWCYGRQEALITSDISSPQLTLWAFNLSTSHWTQMEVKVPNGIGWPACSDKNSVRYAGNEDEVYVLCSRTKAAENSSQESTDSSSVPSKDNYQEKLVFRINYGDRTLYDLGSIRLNSFFDSPEGEKVWQNESQSVLQVIGNNGNETILVLAYEDMVDLWVLSKGHSDKESFHLVEKIWRGSALKWFDKYNAALYSMQFVSESGDSETVLVANPRKIGANEYWPRERGRFIIRVFRNENLKNQTFENRTREQNLTYELLQSDYKPNGSESHLNHMYSLKVLVFFGISLAIFSVFGIVLFLKRCVNCPPRIPVRNECHKSPLVIRYSVIPDDLLYPLA